MTSELDLPLLPSAEQIRRREFATIRRGYDPDQVRDYLLQVAAQVEILEQELREARLKTQTTAARPGIERSPGDRLVPAEAGGQPGVASAQQQADDVYERLAKRFSGLIATADKEASRIVEEAKVESSRIIDRARSEADRIRVDAQARAEEARQQGNEALQKAREEAQRILSGLSHRRESLVSQMDEMRGKLLSVARDLEAALSESGPHGARPETRTPYQSTPSPSSSFQPSSALSSSARPPAPQPSMGQPATASPSERPAAASPSAPGTSEPRTPTFAGGPSSGSHPDEDPVDPRYEDLWVSPPAGSRDDPKSTVDIPDLAAIDVEFDDERRSD